MERLKIKYKDPVTLKPRPKNPRTHTAKQIKQVAASIKEFGFITPVLIDGNDGIVAGHARVEAAKQLKMPDVPTVCVDHLSPTQIRAYVIADNKLAENAGWDRALLSLELKELAVELNFDVTLTGFEMGEADILIGEADQTDQDDEFVAEIDRSAPPVTQSGDLWQLGSHFLYCGNALLEESYRALLGRKKAQMVFVDPPYNVPIVGHVSGKGRKTHREFAMASGEMTSAEFTAFLNKAFQRLIEFSSSGSIHFICMDWRHIRETIDAADPIYSELKNLCVWAKTNAGMGSLYRSMHELVFVYKNGDGTHINNVELGRFGRNRTNVWHYAGANSFGKSRDQDLSDHPTTKPINLVADAILDCSKRGGIVLDAFAGSGTTLLAAEKSGRRGYGIELDAHYTDVVIRRFKDTLGVDAVHVQTGLHFEALKSQRRKAERNGKESKKGQRRRRKSRPR